MERKHNKFSSTEIFTILHLRDWSEGCLAKKAGVVPSIVSAHLSGRRPIRAQHLAAYMRAFNHDERPKLLSAWLRDNLDAESIHDLLNGDLKTLVPAVHDWLPELNDDQYDMLDYWADQIAQDSELEQVFSHLTRKIGFRFRGMRDAFTGPIRIHELTDQAPVFIWMAAAHGATYVSKNWLEFTGTTMRSQLGDGWTKMVHPEDSKRVLRIFRKGQVTRKGFVQVYRLRRKDGKYRWMCSQSAPRFDKRGRFIGFIGCVMDISEALPAESGFKFPSIALISLPMFNDWVWNSIGSTWTRLQPAATAAIASLMVLFRSVTPNELPATTTATTIAVAVAPAIASATPNESSAPPTPTTPVQPVIADRPRHAHHHQAKQKAGPIKRTARTIAHEWRQLAKGIKHLAHVSPNHSRVAIPRHRR